VYTNGQPFLLIASLPQHCLLLLANLAHTIAQLMHCFVSNPFVKKKKLIQIALKLGVVLNAIFSISLEK